MSREPENQDHDIRDSHHDPSGDMGVSSEREGPTGPGQTGTDGVRDVTTERPDTDTPPEQRPGNKEENPEGLEPKAGYSKADPRSDD